MLLHSSHSLYPFQILDSVGLIRLKVKKVNQFPYIIWDGFNKSGVVLVIRGKSILFVHFAYFPEQ